MSSHAIRPLTDEQAEDRLDWLLGPAAGELISTLGGDALTPPLVVTEETVARLRDLARVARQVAKHYEARLTEEPTA